MDWTGNSKSIYATLGASNHTDKEREINDYYATDPAAIDYLLSGGGGYITQNMGMCLRRGPSKQEIIRAWI